MNTDAIARALQSDANSVTEGQLRGPDRRRRQTEPRNGKSRWVLAIVVAAAVAAIAVGLTTAVRDRTQVSDGGSNPSNAGPISTTTNSGPSGAPSTSVTESTSSTAVTPGGRTYQILPAPTKTVDDPSGLRLDPPTANPTTLISPAEAMALCDPTADGRFAVNGCTDVDVPALIQLVLVTSPNEGTAGKDGSVIPTVDGRTAYLIKFPDQKCMFSGPPVKTSAGAGANEASPTRSALPCERSVVVNASNGAWITAGEYQVR